MSFLLYCVFSLFVLFSVVECGSGISVSTAYTGLGHSLASIVRSAKGKTYLGGRILGVAGVIYSLDADLKTVSVVAGSTKNDAIDGIGTNAGLSRASSLTFDPRSSTSNHLYFVDYKTNILPTPFLIRKLNVDTGEVRTVLGNGGACGNPPPDPPVSEPALSAFICDRLPAINMDNAGNIYLLDHNILRKFNVDSGMVQTIVGVYVVPANLGFYIDSANGLNAYMPNPKSIVLHDNNAFLLGYSGNPTGIVVMHRINLTDPLYPMMTSLVTSASAPTGSADNLQLVYTCASKMNPSTVYAISACASSTSSGQLYSIDLLSNKATILAGSGDCIDKDGSGDVASFTSPSTCSLLTDNTNGEMIAILDAPTSTSYAVRIVGFDQTPNKPNSSLPSSAFTVSMCALISLIPLLISIFI